MYLTRDIRARLLSFAGPAPGCTSQTAGSGRFQPAAAVLCKSAWSATLSVPCLYLQL